MSRIYLYTLTEPQLWRAGFLAEKPIYFDCCGCHQPKPIAGYIATTDPPRHGTLVIRENRRRGWELALYCAECWPDERERLVRLSEAEGGAPPRLTLAPDARPV